jgi:hypothetical protein
MEDDRQTEIVAFRLRKDELAILMQRAKREESPSNLMRRIVREFVGRTTSRPD